MKKIVLWLCLLLCLYGIGFPVTASAKEFDAGCSGTLTLHYVREGTGFPELKIQIFRVAKYLEDGSYVATEPFDGYPIKIHNITSQKEWKDLAYTLESYTLADALKAASEGKTDSEGAVVFENLPTGLYLVAGADAKTKTEKFRFEPFMIFVPTPEDSGGYQYDLIAKPKSGEVTSISHYTLLKLWKDTADTASRPKEITVEIYKDSVLWETVLLNQDNHWSYQWDTQDTGSRWSVLEKEVPPGYTVSVTEKGNAFTIVNTKETPQPTQPSDPPATPQPSVPPAAPTPNVPVPSAPKTGDSSPLWLYMLLVGISGLGLIIMGVLWNRKDV